MPVHDRLKRGIPQVPPVEQLLELSPGEEDEPPLVLAAKVDSFFFTFGLPHVGQMTFSDDVLRTSFSNGSPQSAQSNSKIGIRYSC